MSKVSQSRAVDLAMAVAVTMFLPLAYFILWPMLMRQMSPSPRGPTLVYQVDPDALPRGITVDMDLLGETVDQRINSGKKKLAEVRQGDDQQIEVAMLRPDEAEREKVEKLLKHTAILEFRILASKSKDTSLVHRATADPAIEEILDDQGQMLARWVRVKAAEAPTLQEYDDIALRTKKTGDRETTEALVVADKYNLSGAYLIGAQGNIDYRNRPELELRFNAKGGRLFSRLTGSHLPDKGSNQTYKLGIIVDNELYSAPLIVSIIYDRAQIVGSFSKQEIDDLVDMLDGGSLPARIRLVEKNKTP
jgi:SecD/SecF fusion protein